MKVVTFSHSGASVEFAPESVPDPIPGPGEVRIRVAAAGVNRADILQRQGAYPAPAGAPEWLGLEVSGVVDAVGEGATNYAVGDAVCALLAGGGYAELVTVNQAHVLPAPEGVTLMAAAGIMEAACTVWSNLRAARAVTGDTLLVHGGSGGIGTTAIQIAKAMGLTVWATARTRKRAERCAALGADAVVAYAEDPPGALEALGQPDIILDVLGGSALGANVDLLAAGGRLMVIGLQGGTRGELDLGALMRKRASIAGSTLRSRPDADKAAIVEGVGREVWPWIPSSFRPVIHATYPLEAAGKAHAALESGEVFGKVLLIP